MNKEEAEIHLSPQIRTKLKRCGLYIKCVGCVHLWNDGYGRLYCNSDNGNCEQGDNNDD